MFVFLNLYTIFKKKYLTFNVIWCNRYVKSYDTFSFKVQCVIFSSIEWWGYKLQPTKVMAH